MRKNRKDFDEDTIYSQPLVAHKDKLYKDHQLVARPQIRNQIDDEDNYIVDSDEEYDVLDLTGGDHFDLAEDWSGFLTGGFETPVNSMGYYPAINPQLHF